MDRLRIISSFSRGNAYSEQTLAARVSASHAAAWRSDPPRFRQPGTSLPKLPRGGRSSRRRNPCTRPLKTHQPTTRRNSAAVPPMPCIAGYPVAWTAPLAIDNVRPDKLQRVIADAREARVLSLQVKRLVAVTPSIKEIELVARWCAAAVHRRRPHRRYARQRHRALLFPAQRSHRDTPLRHRRAARGREPRRLDLRPRSPARGRPARELAADQQLSAQRGRRHAHPDRRRHRHHAAQVDGAPAAGVWSDFRAALLRPGSRTCGLSRRAHRVARRAAARASRRRRPVARARRGGAAVEASIRGACLCVRARRADPRGA